MALIPYSNYFKISKIWMVLLLSFLGNGQRYYFTADIFPIDATVFIGESLRFVCTLKPTANCSLRDVYFTFTPKNGVPWSVFDGLTVMNKTTVSLLVEITENNFTGLTTVDCMGPEKSLKSIFVHAERPIQNVTDFSGVYLYKDNINLTWKLGQEYLDDIDISVDTKWNPFSIDGSYFNCSKNTKNSCVINQTNYGDQEIIFINITVSSKRSKNRPGPEYLQPLFKTWATSVYQFSVLDNTQCDAPRDLILSYVDKSCMHVSWRDPSYLVYCTLCQKFFQIQLQSRQGDNEDSLKRINGTYTNANDSIQICNLKPFTKYLLKVQLKGGQPNPWSEWATVEGMTLEDRPLTGPPMLSTNYHEESCEDNKRKVYLYWNESSRDSLQGESTMFEVAFNNETYQLRKGTNFFHEFLECDAQYKISISSATKVGTSISPSVILIPRASETLPIPSNFDFKVEELSDPSTSSLLKNLKITWRASIHEEDVSLYVYMCQESYQRKICFDEHRIIEVNMTKEALFLTNVTGTVNLIGYALSHKNGQTHGIDWTECVFNRDAEPGKPRGLRVSAGTVSGSLEISWVATPCSRTNKTLIVQYNLSVCSTKTPLDPCQGVNVSGSVGNYTATGLLENHQYVVSIRAETPFKQGPRSEVAASTGSKNDSGSDKLVIAMPVTIGVIVVTFLVVFIIWRCIKSGNRLKRLLDDTAVLSNSSMQITYLPQTSTESGVYSSSQRSQQSCRSENEIKLPPKSPVHPSYNEPVHQHELLISSRSVDHLSPITSENVIALEKMRLDVNAGTIGQPSPVRIQGTASVDAKVDGSRPFDEYVRVANGSAGQTPSHHVINDGTLIGPREPHTHTHIQQPSHSHPQHPAHLAIYVALDDRFPVFQQAKGNQSTLSQEETQQCVSPPVQEYVSLGILNGQSTAQCPSHILEQVRSNSAEEADSSGAKAQKVVNMQSRNDYVPRPQLGYISSMDHQTELSAAEKIHLSEPGCDNKEPEGILDGKMDLTDLCTSSCINEELSPTGYYCRDNIESLNEQPNHINKHSNRTGTSALPGTGCHHNDYVGQEFLDTFEGTYIMTVHP